MSYTFCLSGEYIVFWLLVTSCYIRSGSMAGQKLSILRLASLSLLETLQENDFVNIVAVVSDFKINTVVDKLPAKPLITILGIKLLQMQFWDHYIAFCNIWFS